MCIYTEGQGSWTCRRHRAAVVNPRHRGVGGGLAAKAGAVGAVQKNAAPADP